MTAVFSTPVDVTGGSTNLAAAVDSLSVGANERIGVVTYGSKVTFFKYPVS